MEFYLDRNELREEWRDHLEKMKKCVLNELSWKWLLKTQLETSSQLLDRQLEAKTDVGATNISILCDR